MKDPLVVPALSFAAGIAVSRLAAFSAAEVVVCLATGVTAWASSRWLGRIWLGHLGIGLTCAALGLGNGAFRAGATTAPATPPEGTLQGCVVEAPVWRGDRLQFTLELDSGARVRLGWSTPPRGAPPVAPPFGRRIAVKARLRPVRSYRNPGSFDIGEYYARRGIVWFGSIRQQAPATVEPGYCQSPLRRAIAGWRATALANIDRLYPGDSYRSAMMRGLLLGDQSGIRKAWTEDFRRSGTYHALVISGSHVTLVCGIFLLWLRRYGYGARTLLAISALTAWLYALLAGADPPVARAAAGLSLYVTARFFHRRARVLNLLAAVVLAFLIADPRQLFDASFQLSFLSVAAIGAFLPRPEYSSIPAPGVMSHRLELRLLAETLRDAAHFPLNWAQRLVNAINSICGEIWALFRVSFAVQVGLALPMVVLFHRLSISGLTANLAVVPLLSAAIPAGFVALFTGWRPVAALAGWLLDRSRGVAAFHAGLEPLWRVPDPPAWLALLFTAALLACTFPLARRLKWAAGTACAVLLALIVVHPFDPASVPGQLELTAIDVGQGDSLLLALPDRQMMMVDTGGLPAIGRARKPEFDVGEEVVSPYLWRRGVRRLAALAITHLHEDHAGGAIALLENFRPRELWTGFTPDVPAWRVIEAKARKLGVAVRTLRQGDRFTLGGVAWEVLAPAREQPWSGRARNNDSLVLRATWGRHKFLLTGDIDRMVERRLLDERLIGHIDVLKVAHHGSKTSLLADFLDAARPAVALISVGAGNYYGLPNPATISALNAHRTLVLRTDRDGLTGVRSDGRYLAPGAVDAPPAWLPEWDLF